MRHLRWVDSRKVEWWEATCDFPRRGIARRLSSQHFSPLLLWAISHNHCASGTEQPMLRLPDCSSMPSCFQTALFMTANKCTQATEAHVPAYNGTWHLVKKILPMAFVSQDRWWTSPQICCESCGFPAIRLNMRFSSQRNCVEAELAAFLTPAALSTLI